MSMAFENVDYTSLDIPAAPFSDPARIPDFPKNKVPRHIGVIMDGNGRWAKQRGMVRTNGHQAAEPVVFDTIAGAIEAGVRYLSLYTFSTENWKRSPQEVRFLMGFSREIIHRRVEQMDEWGVRVRWSGRRPKLWKSVIDELEAAEERTKNNKVIDVVFCINYGGRAEIADACAAIAQVEQAALTAGWDGAWFRRAYDAFGKPVGSKECDEGQIFIEPQGMCVMAGIGKETGQAEQALKSVEERLDTKYGVVLLQPAYTTYRLNLGEISSYPPGYKENAGIFCHNNPWISCAETVLGHGDRAFEVYKKTCPAYIEDISDIHRTEPYVYSQMVAGKDAPTFGEAKNSWLTGTAAWTFFNVSQYILGVQPTLDGLKIDPCIPHTLSGFTVTRRYRGAVYHIRVENPAAVQKGVKRVTVNGKTIEGNVLPLAPAGEAVEVTVVMG